MGKAKHEAVLVKGRRLGKHKARLSPTNFALARFIDFEALPPMKPTLNLSGKVTGGWPMFYNDQIGDCAIAAPGHEVEAWSANANVQKNVAPSAILKAYEDVSGYTPNDPSNPTTNSTDTGCNMEDVLKYWRTTGIGGDKIVAYAFVNTKDTVMMRQAMGIFGGIYCGLGLPLTAQSQVGTRWTVVRTTGNGAPYSWGGHAINLVDYNRLTAVGVTWGALQAISWKFITTYADEAFAIITQDWLNSKGQTIDGFNEALLQSDLSDLHA